MSRIDEPAVRSHYHYRISLRVRHPSMAPEKITEALGIVDVRSLQRLNAKHFLCRGRRAALAEHPFSTLKCRAGYRHFFVPRSAAWLLKPLLQAMQFTFQRFHEENAAKFILRAALV